MPPLRDSSPHQGALYGAPVRPRWARILVRVFAVVIGLIGIYLAYNGFRLVRLGGTPYYIIAGAAYLVAAALMWTYRISGAWLIALVALLTIPWALWERGLVFWALFPRLLMPLGFAAAALLLAAPLALRGRQRQAALAGGVLAAVATVVMFGMAFVPHGAIKGGANRPFQVAAGDNAPSDWTAYGRTTAGTRHAPFDQINRDNVDQLEVAWTHRTGYDGKGFDQNTPLAVGDMVYTCTPENKVSALDADTGEPRWEFDAKAESPFWQRCRGLGYFDASLPGPLSSAQPAADTAAATTPAAPATPAPAAPVAPATAPANAPAQTAANGGEICQQRIVMTTIDARLMELDAKTGELCTEFGTNGAVSLAQNMGEIKPGFYFQTSAPLVAGDVIVIGGWVADNRERGEPSGVIRGFNARTGELAWAWDLGNPAITKEPPPGETYTRGTPNMWTTASYDAKLNLVYLPLGNATPDYFGQGRPPGSDEYNASLVALDATTGRERWKFRTVNHDIWDYDLPSQPALMDLPDGNGGTVPAIMQTTKRGQIFLLNRETGEPIADVEEKPVPQEGHVPEEKLAPTQPYSVGMPTMGATRLTESTMWGATMLDQLWCRVSFRSLRYDGDFTPIGLKPAIEHPGNLGGFNWGSVSFDPVNNLAFVNDTRVPTLFWLVPRDQFAEASKAFTAGGGHGPSLQDGTPYGMIITMWFSPIDAPCVEPPFGTVSAIDMNTREVAWSVPAGTAERLGPWGLESKLPMPMGMPSYAGTMATAGGLVFFAGTQDYYLRAYDAQTGAEVWKHALPVGSSATPMTYVSPKTGKQYIVISVGGAAQSKDRGDYVMAFALPEKSS